jgi:hypothetical protein
VLRVAMRRARRTPDGQWHVVEEREGLSRIGAVDWGLDREGRWPRVDLSVKDLHETVVCPACGTTWTFEEMDCVFGTACREGNDVIAIVRCANCRLPHRTKAVGFVTAYPRLARLMAGWLEWDKRRTLFEAEEERLYGPAGEDP